jgi:hypothetical protein
MKRIIDYRRGSFCFIFAVALAIPALFEQTWKSGFAAIAVTILNFPGILLTGRFFPPEGFPGQSPLHATLMIALQCVWWYLVISLLRFLSIRRRDSS